jgi:ketosteroid isomerase-like protein
MRSALFAMFLVFVVPSAFAEDVRAAIDARNQEWTDAFNRGDIKAVSAIYGEGFTAIPSGQDPITDRAAFEKVLESLKPLLKDLRFETVSLKVQKNFAYEIGKSHYSLVAEDGSTKPGYDNYLVIWKKGADGVWYYHVDSWWGSE